MNIIVCLKQVPHPDHFSEIVFDPVTKRLHREGVPLVINPVDRNAITAGLEIKERFSGKLTALTMCPPEAREALEEALAIGADEAVLLCDEAFAGADTLATAYTLAVAIKKFYPFDLILCGNETIDSGTAQVGPQLAEFLDIPHVTNVRAIDFSREDMLQVERSLENGNMKVEVSLPALIAVNKNINEPRLPTVAGIMEVVQKEFKTFGLDDLGILPEQVGLLGSPTQMAWIVEVQSGRRGEVLRGEPGQVAREVIARLRELHIL